MSFNSFQKNPFINNNSSQSSFNNNHNEYSNYDKLGRKTVEQVKSEMLDVKFGNKLNDRKTEVREVNIPNRAPDYQSRINNLRNINK